MITKSKIDKYLDSIPPIPETIKSTLFYLERADMVQAANVAKKDRVFCQYLSLIVNKPIFGFREEIKNVNQIFGILGLSRAKQVIFSYYMHIIQPKKWEVFDFTNKKFQDLQANLMIAWSKILKGLNIEDEYLEQSITLIPATLIVCEMLFRDIKDTIHLLRQTKQVSYDEILYKMSGYRFLDIVEQIAIKWDFCESKIAFIRGSFENSSNRREALFLKLLLSYEMSKPYMISSGLNDFFDFEIDFQEDEMILFNSMLGIGAQFETDN